jgi:MinD superfamily P-loop ATPase
MLNVKSQEAPIVEEGLKTALIQVQVLGGATAALIVTDPTISGRHDMERVAELATSTQRLKYHDLQVYAWLTVDVQNI